MRLRTSPDQGRPLPAGPADPGVEPDTRWLCGAEGVGARTDADETRSEEAPVEAAVDGDRGAGDVAAAGRDEERDHLPKNAASLPGRRCLRINER